ncbi:MAG TPA: four helix bundle protein [Patescibacteria group bacterium]
MDTYRFEKLRVYQNALNLVEKIYQLSKKLPFEEKFALTDQLKRASISIVLNIAEGTGSKGDIEFMKFLRIALKSLYETVAGLKIAERLFGIKIENEMECCSIVGKELHSLIKSLNKESKSPDSKD